MKKEKVKKEKVMKEKPVKKKKTGQAKEKHIKETRAKNKKHRKKYVPEKALFGQGLLCIPDELCGKRSGSSDGIRDRIFCLYGVFPEHSVFSDRRGASDHSRNP